MKWIPIIVTSATIFSLTVCGRPDIKKSKIRIVVSIQPLAEFCEQTGGKYVDVSVMVPAGASPHSYEPTPGQLVDVGRADLYVKVGTPIDFELTWLDKILSTNPDITVCDASAQIALLDTIHAPVHDDRENVTDPHIWLAPPLAKKMVLNISEALCALDAARKDHYAERALRYIAQLDSLDREIRVLLKEKTQRAFIVNHPAWGYFAQEYELTQISVEEAGKSPTAKNVQRVIKQAQAQDIHVVFASGQFSTKSAEVIAREIKGTVIIIDPLGKEYLTNMREVARALARSME